MSEKKYEIADRHEKTLRGITIRLSDKSRGIYIEATPGGLVVTPELHGARLVVGASTAESIVAAIEKWSEWLGGGGWPTELLQ